MNSERGHPLHRGKGAIRLLIALLAVTLALTGALVLSESESSEATSGNINSNLSYELIDGELTISGTGAMPDTLYFAGRTDVTSLVISEGVTHVGDGNFLGCTNLSSVELPSTLTSIGRDAFAQTAIQGVDLASLANLRTIGSEAFLGSSLTSVTIPATVTSVGNMAFADCSSLQSVTVLNSAIVEDEFWKDTALTTVNLEGVRTIDQWAFRDCSALTGIDLPSTLTYIEGQAFENSGLTGTFTVDVDGVMLHENFLFGTGVTDLVITGNDVVFNGASNLSSLRTFRMLGADTLPYGAFALCTNLESVVLGHVRVIDEWAFYNCSSLSDVTVSGVEAINDMAFSGCSSLTSWDLTGVRSVGSSAFSGCTSLTSLTFPETRIDIGGYAFYGVPLTTLELPLAGNLSGYALDGMNRLTSAILHGDSSSQLGADIFDDCDALRSLTLQGFITIGEGAFVGLELDRLVLPDTLVIIGDGAFSGLHYGGPITLPESVRSIGMWAFGGSTITGVTIPSGLVNIGFGAFFDNVLRYYEVSEGSEHFSSIDGVLFNADGTSLIAYPGGKADPRYVVPSDCVELCENAFTFSQYLCSITLHGGIQSIGYGALAAPSLEEILLAGPSTHFSVEDGVLFNVDGTTLLIFPCGRAGSYTVPDGCTTIGEAAFSGTAISEVTLSDTVVRIQDGAFSWSALTSIVFGENLQYIGEEAFYGAGVTSLVLPDSLVDIGEAAFEQSALSTITLPAGLVSIGDRALMAYDLEEILLAGPSTRFSVVDGVLFNADGTVLLAFPAGRVGSYVIPNGVVEIAERAFCGSGVTDVSFPALLTRIGDYAFQNSSIGVAMLPDSVTYVGVNAFYGCNALRLITVPAGATVTHERNGFTYGITNLRFFDGSSELTGQGVAGHTYERGMHREYGWEYEAFLLTTHVVPIVFGVYVDGYEGDYDGIAHPVTVSVSKNFEWDSVTYEWHRITTQGDSVLGVNSPTLSFTDVSQSGTYYVVISWTLDGDSDQRTSVPVDVTIRPRVVEKPEVLVEIPWDGWRHGFPSDTPAGASYTGDYRDLVQLGDWTEVTFTIDADNCVWSDGTTDPVVSRGVIVKADYDMSGVTFVDGSFVYDGTAHSLVITGDLPVGIDGVPLTVTYSGTATNVADGQVTVTATFATESQYYNVPEPMTALVSITKAPSSWSKLPVAANRIYDIYQRDLLTKGTAVGGDAQYNADGGTWARNSPQRIDAGTYVVGYRIVGDDNHLDTAEAFLTVTIDQMDIGGCRWTVTSPIYNGTEKTATITVSTSLRTLRAVDYTIRAGTDRGINAGNYLVVVEGTGSCFGTLEIPWVIQKATVGFPSIDSQTYTGSELTATVPESDRYVVQTPATGIHVGSYSLTLRLTDPANYAWVGVVTETRTIDNAFQITKATNSFITAPSIAGWTYGQTASEPVGTAMFGDIVYTYSSEEDGTYVSQRPSNAGDWYMKAVVVDCDDYSGLETKVSFTIAKATVGFPSIDSQTYTGSELTASVPASERYSVVTPARGTVVGAYSLTLELTDADNYTWSDVETAVKTVAGAFQIIKAKVAIPAADETVFTYNGGAQTYNVVTSDDYTVSGNVRTVSGLHTVTVTLNDPDNHEWTDGTVTDLSFVFVINKLSVAKPVADSTSFVYDGTEKTYSVTSSRWYAVTGDHRTFAGSQNVTVSLVNKDDSIWADSTVDDLTFTFTIAKATVEFPVIASQVYTGSVLTASVPASERYAVVTPAVGTAAGTYALSLELTDPANYAWSDVGTAVKTVSDAFQITKATNTFTTAPSIAGWTYGQTAADPVGTAAFGEIVFTYSHEENGTYVSQKPSTAGDWYMKASVADCADYSGLDVMVPFTVARTAVVAPVIASQVYTGSELEASVPESPRYSVVSTAVGTHVGTYDMVLRLTDADNYAWSDVDTATKVVTFEITKAINVFTTAPSIAGWTYGQTAASPVGAARFGDVAFTYSSEENGTYVAQRPSTAGDWYMKASVADCADYSGLEVKVPFTIAKAQVAIPAADETVFTYSGTAQTYNVASSPDYSVSGNVRMASGTTSVTVSLDDPDNHEWTDGTITDLSFVFVINKLAVTRPVADSTVFIYDGTEKTYAVAPSPWYTVSGDVRTLAGSQTVTVTLVNKDDTTWNDSTVTDLTYTFAIAKATVDFPVIASQTYTGSVLTASVPTSERYAVVIPARGTDVGIYALTLELTDSANYAWSDVDTAVKTVADAFQITKATNSFTVVPSIAGWTYGQTASVPAGAARFGEIVYTYSSEENGTYVSQRPSNAGDWYMKAIVADCANYSGLDVKVPFTITKAKVAIPAADETVFTFNGNAQTYVIVANADYTVSGNVKTVSGTTSVTVALDDPDNHEWTDGTVTDLSFVFVINKLAVTRPVADSTVFTYDGTGKTYAVAPSPWYTVYGDVRTLAGSQTVTVTLVNKDDTTWNDSSVSDLTYTFAIAKATVDFPVIASQTYTGSVLTASVPASERYTVVTPAVGTAAGMYALSLELTDSANYTWSDVDPAVKTVADAFQITKAINVFTPAPSIAGWTYGQTASVPVGAARFGEIVYTYSSEEDGTYVSQRPSTAGDWYMKASVADCADYSGLETRVPFTIAKAQVAIPVTDTTVFTYNGSPQTYNVAASDDYTVSGNVKTVSGISSVSVALNDTANHEWADGTITDLSFVFIINKLSVVKPVADTTVFVYDGNEKVYNMPSSQWYSVTGDHRTNAGSQTVTVTLVNKDDTTWNDSTVTDLTYTFAIAKATVDFPVIASQTYTGSVLTASVPASERYIIVTPASGTLVGTYALALELTDADNYTWSDVGTAVKTVSDAFQITKATNSFTVVPFIAGWTYGQTASVPAGAARFGEIVYTYSSEENGTYVSQKPSNAGDWYMRAIVADCADYSGLEVKVPFTIAKAQVAIPAADETVFTFNGNAQTYILAASSDYTVSGNVRTASGIHSVIVSLVDSDNHVWSDGTIADLSLVFIINKLSVAKPVADSTVFVYDGTDKTYSVAESDWYTVTGDHRVPAGSQTVTVSLVNGDDTAWSDSTTTDLTFAFNIAKATVDFPVIASQAYTGTVLTASVPASEMYTVITPAVGTAAGMYALSLELTDSANYAWSDVDTAVKTVADAFQITKATNTFTTAPSIAGWTYGQTASAPAGAARFGEIVYTYSSEEDGTYVSQRPSTAGDWYMKAVVVDCDDYSGLETKVSFTITKAQVAIPAADETVFTFNGNAQTYIIAASSDYTVSGNVKAVSGITSVTVGLNDTVNHEWTDGTIADLSFVFIINKLSVDKPVADSTVFVYDGSEKVYNMPSSQWYSVTGDHRTNAGAHTVAVSLVNKDDLVWNDSTTADLTFAFNIAKAIVDFPVIASQVYTGSVLTASVPASEMYTVITPASGTLVGTYALALGLTDADNHTWSDVGTAVKTVADAFQITKAKVAMPVPDETVFTYSGTAQTYSVAPNANYTVSDNVRTASGTTSVTVSLDDPDNHEWTDGTVTDLSFVFVINKLSVAKPEADSTIFIYDGTEKIYNVAASPWYTVSGNNRTLAGSQTVTVTLVNKDDTIWSDSTVTDLTFVLDIARADYDMSGVTLVNGSFAYDGIAHGLTVTGDLPVGADGVHLTVVYAGTATNVADGPVTVTATFSTASPNYNVPEPMTALVSVTKATNSFTVAPSIAGWTYGQAAADPVGTAAFGEVVFTYSSEENGTYVVQKPSAAGAWYMRAVVADCDDYAGLDVRVPFTISKVQVTIPEADTTVFTYNGSLQTYNVAASDDYTVSGNVRMASGTTSVTVSLRDSANHEWSDGTVTDLSFVFVINKLSVAKPVADSTSFVYDGTEKVYNVASNQWYTVSGNHRTLAGSQEVTVVLVNKDDTVWSDSTTANLTFVFNIAKAQVAIPEADDTVFTFNGSLQTYHVAPNANYTVSGNVKAVSGISSVSVALNDPVNHEWTDGTVTDLSFVFTINKMAIAKPAADPTTFTYDGTEKVYSVASSQWYTVSGNHRTLAGSQDVTVALVNKDDLVWNDSTTADLTFAFNIARIQVAIPVADETIFTYNGSPQTYNVAASDDYTVSGNVKTASGITPVTVALKDVMNHEWSDGTISDLSLVFNINRLTVTRPVADSTSFVYDGTEKTYAVAPSQWYSVTGDHRTLAGSQNVTVTLTNKDDTVWNDSTTSDIVFTFTISKIQVAIPAADQTVFTYNGSPQTYSVEVNANYSVSGNVKTVSGIHTVTVTLNETSNHEWSDGTVTDLSFVFIINKLSIAKPAADSTVFVYDGTEKTFNIATSPWYVVNGDHRTLAGSQNVTVTLSNKDDTTWADSTTADLTFVFSIAKAKVAIPEADDTVFTYNGTAQTYNVAPNANYSVSGNVKAVSGIHIVTVALNETSNHEWSDGTVTDLSFVFIINKLSIVKPVADTTAFVYDGNEKVYSVAASQWYSVTGDHRTLAGSQNVTVRLANKDDTVWADSTTSDLTFVFNIAKAQVAIPEADDTVFTYNGTAQTYSVAANVNYSVSGNVKTVSGIHAVTVALNETSNHEWTDGTITDLSFVFIINKLSVVKPVADTTVFIYDGTEKTYAVAPSQWYSVTGDHRTLAGSQNVTVALSNRTDTVWNDSSTADLTFAFNIAKAQVAIPAADTTVFTYNGTAQTYSVAPNVNYTVSDNVRTASGISSVSVALNDTANHEWTDGTVTDLSFVFVINRLAVTIPAADVSEHLYDGHEQVYAISPSEWYTVRNDTRTMPGTQTVSVVLKNKDDTTWSDSTVTDLEFEFTIIPTQQATIVSAPAVVSGLVYNGTSQALVQAGTASDGTLVYSLVRDGPYGNEIPAAVNAGTYTVFCKALGDEGFLDSDVVSVDVTVGRLVVEVPVAVGGIYDGRQIQALASTELFTVTGAQAVDAGDYVATVTLVDPANHEWSEKFDGMVSWSISRAVAKVSEVPRARALVANGAAQELVLPGASEMTLVYSLDGTNFGTSVPAMADAGTYTVHYKVLGDRNHVDSEVGTVKTVIIAAKTSGNSLKVEVDTEAARDGVDITGIMQQSSHGNGNTTIQLDNGGKVVFNKAAVDMIAESSQVVLTMDTVSVEKASGDISKAGLEENEAIVEISLGGVAFSDGSAEVSVPLKKPVPAGKTAKVYYVAPNGEKALMDCRIVGDDIVFTTNHFSTYVVVFEDVEDSPQQSNVGLLVAVGAIAAFIVVVFSALTIRRRRA